MTAINTNENRKNGIVLKQLLVLFLVISGLYFARTFLIPVAIAVVLSTLFLPLCNWLERRKINRGIASLICLLILLAGVSSIAFFLGWKVNDLAGDFSLVRSQINAEFNQVQYFLDNSFGITAEQQAELFRSERTLLNQMLPFVAGSVFKFVTQTVLVIAYFFLILFYRQHLRIFILRVVKTTRPHETKQIIHQVALVSQNYLLGVAKMIVCLWILYAVAFSALGLEDALFFAILCGLLELVPYVGNLAGTVITLLVAAAHGASPGLLAGILLVYVGVQLIQGWILEPFIVGPHVRINPLFTVLAIVIGHLIWGLAGIFLAIPLMAMFKIVCDHVEGLKPYGFLVGAVSRTK